MSEGTEQTLIVPCPQCGTRFRVAPELLTVADGQVRCGACFTVFDGNAVVEVAASAPTPPAPPSAPPGGTLDEPPGGEASPPNAMGEPQPEAPPMAPFHSASMPDDTHGPQTQDQPAFAPQAPHDNVGAQPFPPLPDDQRFADVAAPDDPAMLEPQPPTRVGARMIIGRGDGRRSRADRESRPAKRTTTPRLLAAVLAAALLPFNILAFGFEPWAREPALRPVYQVGCDLLGCQVPAPRDLEALALTPKSVARADAGAAIVITAALSNHAAYPQSLPAVAARFTDANNQLVSEERLAPRDYLPKRPTRRLAPGKAATVEFRFPAPGDSATRYALVLR